jgi:membrane protein DedA with SNARE-associated domain
MGDLIPQLITWATDIIRTIGYPGIAFLVAAEAVFPPVPSEVILPLAGSLAANGTFNPFFVLLSAVIGSCLGATLLYSVGRWGGETRIAGWLDRYGKWVLLSSSDLYTTKAWFGKHGTWAVLVARVLPGMRTFVSIPAGLVSMPYPRFVLLTAIGSGVWNGFLVGAGYFLGKNWDQVQGWIAPFGPIVYGIIILLVLVFVGRRLWTKFGPPSRKPVEETPVDSGH